MAMIEEALTADLMRAYADGRRRREAEKAWERDEATQLERAKLRQHFMELEVTADALSHVDRIVRRAADAGEHRALVVQFPSNWLPDHGGAIKNEDTDWHRHLDGYAKRAYAFFERELRPRGFHLRAEIISSAAGVPRDVGFFLEWKRLDQE